MRELRGCFTWHELLASNIAPANRFYTDVVGWTVEAMTAGGVTYQIFRTSAGPVAAVIDTSADAKSEGALTGWVGYLEVEDVDTVAELICRLGGSALETPSDAPNIGRFAIVADSQGAPIGLFAPTPDNPGRNPPHQAPRGHVAWHEIYASDPDAAFAFYSEVFGWTKGDAFDMGPTGSYQLFAIGGRPTGGIMRKPPGVSAPVWCPFIQVGDIISAEQRVTAGDGTVFDGPREVPDGDWTLKCIAPQGARFSLTGSGS